MPFLAWEYALRVGDASTAVWWSGAWQRMGTYSCTAVTFAESPQMRILAVGIPDRR